MKLKFKPPPISGRLEVLCGLSMNHVEDGAEDRLAARAPDQEPVNVIKFDQVLAVRLSDRSAVKDPRVRRHLLTGVLFEPAPDDLSSLLCLVSTGDLAGVECPDGLISYDYFFPLGRLHALADSLELCGNHLLRPLSLSFLQVLANAIDYA